MRGMRRSTETPHDYAAHFGLILLPISETSELDSFLRRRRRGARQPLLLIPALGLHPRCCAGDFGVHHRPCWSLARSSSPRSQYYAELKPSLTARNKRFCNCPTHSCALRIGVETRHRAKSRELLPPAPISRSPSGVCHRDTLHRRSLDAIDQPEGEASQAKSPMLPIESWP